MPASHATAEHTVAVRTIAFLHTFRKERGLPTRTEIEVPAEGVSGREVASRLGLPLDMIEGLFRNHRLVSLDALVRPGDRVAFLPYGTPATHPAFFGPPQHDA